MAEPTAANLRALEKLVYAYEKSIADLENGVSVNEVAGRWCGYGSSYACLLCQSVTTHKKLVRRCNRCVLGSAGGMSNCVRFGSMSKSRNELMYALCWRTEGPLVIPLRARLKAILKCVDERGYELVERK